MIATLNMVSANPDFYLNSVLKNRDELIISTDSENLVIVPESDWNNMKEKIDLLLDKKSLKSLLEGHYAKDNSTEIKKYDLEEVFNCL